MYAIVEIAGHQYKVHQDQQLFVNRLHADEGAKVQFDSVLLIDNEGQVTVGAPAISGAAITAKVTRHLKGDKVIVFKKKRRKGYRKKNGFRASLTEIQIETIASSGARSSKQAEPKVAERAPEVIEEVKEAAAPVVEDVKEAAAPVVEDVKEVAAPVVEEVKAAVEEPTTEAPVEAGPKDDLTKIEGIGPKIAEHFNAAGILTFTELADASVERLKEILEAAGPRYKAHNPASWPLQSRMAADGQWDELKKWQDEHDAGKL